MTDSTVEKLAAWATGEGPRQLAALPEPCRWRVSLDQGSIVDLSLRELDLTELPRFVVELRGLEALDLSTNRIARVPRGTLPSRLRTLDLDRNRLNTAPDAIRDLPALQTLRLYGNRLAALPASVSKLRHLRELGLAANELTALPDEIDELEDLRHLNLGENAIGELPVSLTNLERVRVLDLGHNRLGPTIEIELRNLRLLETLYLSDNGLRELPDFDEQSALRYLNATHNPLRSLPPSLTSLPKLEELRLYDCGLEQLPVDLGNLRELRELHVRHNRLTALPDSIGELRALEVLDLRANPLRSVPSEVTSLPRLRRLDLRWVKLRSEPRGLSELMERGCRVLR